MIDSTAQLRLVEIPFLDRAPNATAPSTGLRRVKKMIVNVPLESSEKELQLDELQPVDKMKIRGAHTIVGPYVQLVKGTGGSVAIIKAQEGMWEERRGVKVDGGERRKLMVRRNRMLAERKNERR